MQQAFWTWSAAVALALAACAPGGSIEGVGVARQGQAVVAKPAYVKSKGFFVLLGRLYDPGGREFIIRGVNMPHIWFDSYGTTTALDALPAVAGFGFNAVRVVWDTWGNTALLDKILQRVIDLEMVPIVEVHGATCQKDVSALMAMVDYWRRADVKAVLQKHEKHLLLNIANEWSGSDFRAAYLQAVAKLRAAGLNHTLVVDANGCGQSFASLRDHGPALLQADPQHNLLFDVHMYEAFDNGDIAYAIAAASAMRLPLVIGEFGYLRGSPRMVDFASILRLSRDHGIGYLPWSWKGNNSSTAYLDMSLDWAGQNLTQWGKDLIFGPFGIQATSRKACVFLPADHPACGGACTDIPPGSTYTCAQQAAWGKCDQPWMQGHCLRSCGRCQIPCTDTPPDGRYSCAEQVSWGKCDEVWMDGFCDRSCGRCQDPCSDVPPDDRYSCSQQAGWGKCNEPWMHGFCDRTCGRCEPPCTDIPPDDRFTCPEQAGWGKCGEPWMQDYCDHSCGRCG